MRTVPLRNCAYVNHPMKKLQDIALSMLDLVAVREGSTVGAALQIALRTAQHAESLGFKRYWVAEHHNMSGIASSALAHRDKVEHREGNILKFFHRMVVVGAAAQWRSARGDGARRRDFRRFGTLRTTQLFG